MKKILFLIMCLVLCISYSFGQVLIHQESFEDAPSITTYMPSIPFASIGSDHFNRFTGTDSNWKSPITDFDSNYYIGVEDQDGALGTAVGVEQNITLSPVSVSGATNLTIKMLFAAPATGLFEFEDFLIIEYNLDGAGYVKIGEFRGTGGTSSSPSVVGSVLYYDSGRDGIVFSGPDANDVAVSSYNITGVIGIGAMLDYTFDLDDIAGTPVSGESMVIRVRFNSDGSDGSQEEMIFDNIRIEAAVPSCNISGITAGAQGACIS